MKTPKPRNFATVTILGFEAQCDGETLRARIGPDGPWTSVKLPPQDDDEDTETGSADR